MQAHHVFNELAQNPPPEVFQRRTVFPRLLSVMLLNLLTVALLTGCFTVTRYNIGWLGWFAMVPWAIALTGSRKNFRAVLFAWIAGVLFWFVNLWWLTWITLVGYFALVFYLSLYWLAAAMILRAAGNRNYPMWLCLPVVWVALEFVRAYVISGFEWFYLAHSQYASIHLMQICDITGQYGLSFFVAMVNGALVDLLVSPLFARKKQTPSPLRQGLIGIAVSILVFICMFQYGSFRLSQQDTLSPGPVIGVVQQSFPISLFEPSTDSKKIFFDHVVASKAFEGKNCDLVVWPETMLPRGINNEFAEINPADLSVDDFRLAVGQIVYLDGNETYSELYRIWRAYWPGNLIDESLINVDPQSIPYERKKDAVRQYIPDDHLEKLTEEDIETYFSALRQGILPWGKQIIGLRRYRRELSELSGQLGCGILAGGTTLHYDPFALDHRDKWQSRNSVIQFNKDGQQRIYSKMHLVPFGETVGFSKGAPWLYRFLRQFIPDSMPQLFSGDTWQRFEMETESGSWKLATPICFEGTFPRVCRKLVMEDNRKQADILVNLSNDGWFVWKAGNGEYRRSSEHFLHLIQYCFRAVEFRVPVVRSVNTGISASVDSSGRIVAAVDARGNSMVCASLLLDGNRSARPQNGKETYSSASRILVDSRESLYSKVGDLFAAGVSAASALMVINLLFRKKKERER